MILFTIANAIIALLFMAWMHPDPPAETRGAIILIFAALWFGGWFGAAIWKTLFGCR